MWKSPTETPWEYWMRVWCTHVAVNLQFFFFPFVCLHVIEGASAPWQYPCKWILSVRLTACLYFQNLNTSFDSHTYTHTQTGVRAGDFGAWPCWANITLPFPIYVPAPIFLRMSLLCSLCSLSFPLCQTQRTSLLFCYSRKCNWSQICLGFCLISSLLCSCRLLSPCAWPQTASVRLMGTSRAETRYISWCPGSVTSGLAQGDIWAHDKIKVK